MHKTEKMLLCIKSETST